MQKDSKTEKNTSNSNNLRLITLAFVLVTAALAAGAGYWVWDALQKDKTTYASKADAAKAADPSQPAFTSLNEAFSEEKINVSVFTKGLPLPTFEFDSTDGGTFSNADLKGGWHLFFFGFTSCPDICPNTLAELKTAKQLNKSIDHVRVTMVSVDPKRDNVTRLKNYLGYYDPNFLGLTDNEAEIATFNKQLGIPVREVPTGNGGYTVDHSSSLWLINPEGKIAAKFSTPHDAKGLARDIPTVLRDLKSD